jgi:hypothetical protein
MPQSETSKIMDLWNMFSLLLKLDVLNDVETNYASSAIMEMLSNAISKDRMRISYSE